MWAILTGYVVPVLHVLVCLFLIVVVLLQTGKGADMGAVFGGGSQTLFGSSGAGNFLTKLTTGMAIAFMVTSLILTWSGVRMPASTLFDRLPLPGAATEPAPTGAPEAAAPEAAPLADAAPAEAPAAETPPAEPAAPAPPAAAPEPATPPPAAAPAPAPPATPAP